MRDSGNDGDMALASAPPGDVAGGGVVSAVAVDEPPVRAEGAVLIATVDYPVIVLAKAVDQRFGASRRRFRVVRSAQTPAFVALRVETCGGPGDAADGPV